MRASAAPTNEPVPSSHVPDIGFVLELEGDEDDATQVYRVGDLVRDFGLTRRSLRFYKEEDLLRPIRRGKQLLFSGDNRRRLRIILFGRALSFTLSEARDLIDLCDMREGSERKLKLMLERFEA